jgi:hypothetical protein
MVSGRAGWAGAMSPRQPRPHAGGEAALFAASNVGALVAALTERQGVSAFRVTIPSVIRPLQSRRNLPFA